MKQLLLILLMLTMLNGEENPYEDNMEESECWTEGGAPCEVLAEEWEENEGDEDE